MDIRVLGPLEVYRDGAPVEVRGSKRRALLALLVLHANEVVRTGRLIDDLWGATRPANAQGALQNHISRLRKDLGGDVLATKPWGYVLRTGPDDVDLQRFQQLVEEARPLAARERRNMLTTALALWRGPALADLTDEPALESEIGRLDELRLTAIEDRVDADLELGSSSELVGELEALVAAEPLRERLRGQLIVALYRAGRQAEALETYRETRRVLVEELGIEPSPALRELERAILRQDPALVAPPPPSSEPSAPPRARWRWPRSPIALTAGLVFLAGLGAAATVIAVQGTPEQTVAAAPSTATTTTAPPTTTLAGRHHTTSTRPEQTVRTTTPAVVTTRVAVTRQATTTHPATTVVHHATTDISHTSSTITQTAPVDLPPEGPPVISDTFDGSVDTSVWNVYTTGSGPTIAQLNGRVEVFLPGDAVPYGQYGQIAGQYETRCHFPGDFDARVDYELLDWPADNHVNVALAGFMDNPTSYPQVVRQSVNGAEIYVGVPPSFNRSVPTNDRSGRLRITRRNGVFATYYWERAAARWALLAYEPVAGIARINLAAITTASVFGKQDTRVAFDNFVVYALRSTCS